MGTIENETTDFSAAKTGRLKILQRLNKYEFAVEIWAMREGLNNNNWDYRNLKEHYLTFLGQPILIAYVGTKIGDGHNMRTVYMPDGSTEYTFVDGTAERIIGTLSDDEKDFRLEESNGQLWMVAKGRIFTFYAREAVEKIITTGVMDVSVETEVFASENGTNGAEIYTDWAGLGVTILGDDVPPAIPGARIKAMSVREDLEGMKLRAASLLNEATESPTEQQKERVNKAMNKRQIAHLQKQFAGYTVLNASEDGMRVCLASEENGVPAGYVFKDEEDKNHVFPERITPMRVNAVYTFDNENSIEVDVEQILDGISAKLIAANSDNEAKTAKIAELEAKIADMETKEKARRLASAKRAVNEAMEKMNKNMEANRKISKELADKVCGMIEAGCFNECFNEDGEWCGDANAVKELKAMAMDEMTKYAEEDASKKKKNVSWNEMIPNGKGNDETGIDALIQFATTK